MQVTFGFLNEADTWTADIPDSFVPQAEGYCVIPVKGNANSVQARTLAQFDQSFPSLTYLGNRASAAGDSVEVFQRQGQPAQTFLYWRSRTGYVWLVLETGADGPAAVDQLLSGVTVDEDDYGLTRIAVDGALSGPLPNDPANRSQIIFHQNQPTKPPWSVTFARMNGSRSQTVNSMGDVTIVTAPVSRQLAVLVDGPATAVKDLTSIATRIASTVAPRSDDRFCKFTAHADFASPLAFVPGAGSATSGSYKGAGQGVLERRSTGEELKISIAMSGNLQGGACDSALTLMGRLQALGEGAQETIDLQMRLDVSTGASVALTTGDLYIEGQLASSPVAVEYSGGTCDGVTGFDLSGVLALPSPVRQAA